MMHDAAWSTPAARRLLQATDVLAYLTSLTAILLSMARLHWQLPDYLYGQLDGRATPYPSVYAAHAMSGAAALLPLLMMVWRHNAYYQFRTQLCVLNRGLRLVGHIALTSNCRLRGRVAYVVAARTHSLALAGFPNKSVAVAMLQPLVLMGTQAYFVLPLRYAIVLQAVNAAATLQWSAALPCYLQQAAAAAGSSTRVPVFAAAEAVCVRMHELAAFLQLTAALPDGVLSTASAPCSGAAAVRVLHVFCSLLCLFVLPVAGVVWLEWRLAASSSSSGHEVSTTTTLRRGPDDQGQPNSSSGSSHASSSSEPTVAVGVFAMVPPPLWLVGLLVPVVLALVWSVSEVLAGVAGARVDCPAELHAGGVLHVLPLAVP